MLLISFPDTWTSVKKHTYLKSALFGNPSIVHTYRNVFYLVGNYSYFLENILVKKSGKTHQPPRTGTLEEKNSFFFGPIFINFRLKVIFMNF